MSDSDTRRPRRQVPAARGGGHRTRAARCDRNLASQSPEFTDQPRGLAGLG